MNYKWILWIVVLFAAIQLSFTNIFECEKINSRLETENNQYETLENFNFNFRESFETHSVRGIQKADYYSCNGKLGYLLVYQHDKVLLFKDFPIDQWFEFKFTNSPESYYSSQIRFKYVRI